MNTENPRAEGVVETEWRLGESPAYLMMCVVLPGCKVAREVELFLSLTVVTAFIPGRASISGAGGRAGEGVAYTPAPLLAPRRG